MAPPDVPGLQAERTGLAWERTALSALVGAALLLLRHAGASWGTLLAGIAGLALTLLAAATGALRTARLRRAGPAPVARAEVLVVGVGVVLFCALVVVALVIG